MLDENRLTVSVEKSYSWADKYENLSVNPANPGQLLVPFKVISPSPAKILHRAALIVSSLSFEYVKPTIEIATIIIEVKKTNTKGKRISAFV